ncbi:MAG: beta-propeller fold lactonase family protein [Lachnospiraceae bacterium]|nr:beta-propeller fold lactonase family protein [Lachnospiraceae bacterium]
MSERKHLYAASGTGTAGIYHFLCDGDGNCELKDFTPVGDARVMQIRDGKFYAVLRETSKEQDSELVIYALNEDGSLGDCLERYDTLGHRANYLLIDDVTGCCYVTDFGDGKLFRTPDIIQPFHGSSVHPTRQAGPHTHCVIRTPDLKYLAVADLGADEVYLCDSDMNVLQTVKAPAGCGPRQLVFSDDGKVLYCVTEIGSTLLTFSYEDGKLAFEGEVSMLEDGYEGEHAACALKKAGNCLYTTERRANSITIFRTDGLCVERAAIVDPIGVKPDDLAFWGSLVCCANETSGTLNFFRLEADGMLSPLPASAEVPGVLCILFG